MYPQDFPKQSRAAVEAKELEAKQELERVQAEEPPAGFTKARRNACAFLLYIYRVHIAFAYEALELGKQGTWAVDRIRREADEFLRRWSIQAYFKNGHRYPEEVLSKLERQFQEGDEWHQFEAELLAVAKQQAGRNNGAASVQPPKNLGGLRARAAAGTSAGPAAPALRERIDSYLKKLSVAYPDRKFTLTDYYLVSGYGKNRREAERTLAGKGKKGGPPSPTVTKSLERPLEMKPADYVAALDRKKAGTSGC